MGKRVFLLMAASLVALFVIAACSEEQVPTREPVEFNPTAADAVERPGNSGQELPSGQEVDPGAGDPAAGENLFVSCSACHATTDAQVVGPGLAGLYERAGGRTALDADAYIEQSVREPGAFVVDGFPAVMPSFDYFSDDDVKNIIAYLKTLN